MSKLWSKGKEPHAMAEEFTVGNNHILDVTLVPSDIVGSLAHAVMLGETGLLTSDEVKVLKKALLDILDRHGRGGFAVERSDEDCHTAIENDLVEHCGEIGKRIHLGRSRNDQVATALRIWMRESLFELVREGGLLVREFLKLAAAHERTPMPGRTHMQPAMPSSVGLWAASWAEQLLDDLRMASKNFILLDQCPSGSAAGYGVPLPLDRERTAALLGCSQVQVNVASVGLSRGKIESHLLDAADHVGLTLSKFAQDLLMFSLPEFGWFRLPEDLCTGSSIMPQKRNPDVLELMRARSATLSSHALRVKEIIRGLPSGYNADYQETKEPLIQAVATILSMIRITTLIAGKLKVDEEALKSAFNPTVFATDAAIELVAGGMPFRDAYRQVGGSLDTLKARDPLKALEARKSTGMPGNLHLDLARRTLEELLAENEIRTERVHKALESLMGRPVSLL